ncbi:MAG: pentapeptide repeat-containing protein [Chlorobiaceae bacterium]|jgi:uncharacterized protein YjbI with pentapeptide repeats|nr:pentapeptide repeat-containing protein [Chlorobiaceae bacterium]
MAKSEHLQILLQGVISWNNWRAENPEIRPELGGAMLSKAKLNGINLADADLSNAILDKAQLNDASFYLADLRGAHFESAELKNSDLGGSNLTGAQLQEADIRWANISEANLSQANLAGAQLSGSNLSKTKFFGTDLTGCYVYAISAWDLETDNSTKQSDLVITEPNEYKVTVDNLEVAQFVHLMLKHKKLGKVIQTISTKAVLILGRFTTERKAILDAVADELRRTNFLPIIFDFEKPDTRDCTETIRTLASLSVFVIVDITNPKSVPQELMATVPDFKIPFVPILEKGYDQYSMFPDFQMYPWVLRPVIYSTREELVENFRMVILNRAWQKHIELQTQRNAAFAAMSIDDIIKSQ